MSETGMVPVFYHSDIEVAKQVLKACYDGGVRAFEFTNRGDFAQEVFAELVKYAARECPEMIVGIGSIVDPALLAVGCKLCSRPLLQPRDKQGMQPSSCTLHTGMWLGKRNKCRPRKRLHRVQGIPCRQCGRSFVRQEHQGSYAVVDADGNRWRRAYYRKPYGLD